MKNIILALLLSLSFCSCNSQTETKNSQAKIDETSKTTNSVSEIKHSNNKSNDTTVFLAKLKERTVEAMRIEWAKDWEESDIKKIEIIPGSYKKTEEIERWNWSYSYTTSDGKIEIYYYRYYKNYVNGRFHPAISVKMMN